MLASAAMRRATGKQLGPSLVLGAVGLFGGIALFVTVFAGQAQRADACQQMATFMEPRLQIVDRRADEHLAGIQDAQAWRDGADGLADIYFAFGRDMKNRKLLDLDDAKVRKNAHWIGASAVDVGERLLALDGSLARADKLSAATAELRDDVTRAHRRCK